MNQAWKFLFLLLFFFAVTNRAKAQVPGSVTTESLDSLIALLSPGEYDSLMQELDFFLDSYTRSKSSYADISMGIGNGFFTLRNNGSSADTLPLNRLVLMPSAAYYHKSGLGLGWFGFARTGAGNGGLYQHLLNFSYDYQENKKIGFGFSYGRQFTKDSLAYYASPFQNIFSGYANLRKGWLRPGITVSYSTGSYTDVIKRPLFRLAYHVKLTDFTVIASVKHQFVKKKLLRKDDYFVFTPRLLLISSGQQYSTNSPDTRLRRMVNNGFLVASGTTSFRPQSLGLNLSADYLLGKFYLHPQFYMDYFLQTADKRLYTTVSLLAGIII